MKGNCMSASKNTHSRGARSAGDAGADKTWREIESRFRLWSFRLYYDKCYATEQDHTLRFAKALIASSRPIRDRALVYDWFEQQQAKRQRRRSEHGTAAVSA